MSARDNGQIEPQAVKARRGMKTVSESRRSYFMGHQMRVLRALLGSCFISICCSGYSAAQDTFVPLSEQSVEAGAAAAAPKVLSVDIASLFSEGLSEKKIFDGLSHVPATEREPARQRGHLFVILLRTTLIAPGTYGRSCRRVS
jgi:hypothetical protein